MENELIQLKKHIEEVIESIKDDEWEESDLLNHLKEMRVVIWERLIDIDLKKDSLD